MTNKFQHISVMKKEVQHYLSPERGGNFIDCTFGQGGHAQDILCASNDTTVLAIDQDTSAIPQANKIKLLYGKRFYFIHEKFSHIDKVLATHAIRTVDGILFDLGVSSPQLSIGMRGFSFLKNGPLNMKMDQSNTVNTSIKDAHYVVNTYEEKDLANIFWTYGEERFSRRLAKKIVSYRKKNPIHTTFDLLQALGMLHKPSRMRIHPATRIFQALRIYVNNELEEIKIALYKIYNLTLQGWIQKNCRIVVIAFHSLEDRIVKHIFHNWSHGSHKDIMQNRYLPYKEESIFHKPLFVNLTKTVVKAKNSEIIKNPKARSARLRAVVCC